VLRSDRTRSGIGVGRREFDGLLDSLCPPKHIVDALDKIDRETLNGVSVKRSVRRLYLECLDGELLEWIIGNCVPKLPPEDREFGERILAILQECHCADRRKHSLNIRMALPWEMIAWLINRVCTHNTEYFFDKKYKRFRITRRLND